ncbi:MAG TPA: hypothetical protein VF609_06080 [Flavisolibacter sp.]|jgi:hypothetical protein
MKRKFSLLLLLVTAATGCQYDNEEELYNCSVNAATVKYSTTINTILTSYSCIGCHSGSVPSGNVDLGSHGAIKAVADNGRLYGAINHEPGFVPMPHGGGKMNACDIRKVKAWIDAGAPNN